MSVEQNLIDTLKKYGMYFVSVGYSLNFKNIIILTTNRDLEKLKIFLPTGNYAIKLVFTNDVVKFIDIITCEEIGTIEKNFFNDVLDIIQIYPSPPSEGEYNKLKNLDIQIAKLKKENHELKIEKENLKKSILGTKNLEKKYGQNVETVSEKITRTKTKNEISFFY